MSQIMTAIVDGEAIDKTREDMHFVQESLGIGFTSKATIVFKKDWRFVQSWPLYGCTGIVCASARTVPTHNQPTITALTL